jgi:tetratricopeptide (TPR) repeat protein
MNQAHSQQQGQEAAHVTAAINSYEQAIAILRTLPLQDPSLINSLAACWMNRGQLLHRLNGAREGATALQSFDEALTLLRPLDHAANPWLRRNFAGTLLNRACLLVELGEHRAALDSAREAFPHATNGESTELVDADLSLKVRRVACDAIGQLLPLIPPAEQKELASEASDYVDDGLVVARAWEARGEKVLIPLSMRLFRFGAQLYRLHQPHFLAEYITEHLEGSTPYFETLFIANENVEALLNQQPENPYFDAADPASARQAQTVADLKVVYARLADFRAHLASIQTPSPAPAAS